MSSKERYHGGTFLEPVFRGLVFYTDDEEVRGFYKQFFKIVQKTYFRDDKSLKLCKQGYKQLVDKNLKSGENALEDFVVTIYFYKHREILNIRFYPTYGNQTPIRPYKTEVIRGPGLSFFRFGLGLLNLRFFNKGRRTIRGLKRNKYLFFSFVFGFLYVNFLVGAFYYI